MTRYPEGTLLKIEKLTTASGIVDITKENMYGYVTGWWTGAGGVPYYYVYLFPTGKKHITNHHYVSPVTG